MSKFYYECNDCGKKIYTDKIVYLCPDCSKSNTPEKPPKGVLKVIYDYRKIKERYKNDSSLFSELQKNDFLDLLPIKTLASLPYLKVGNTPLYRLNKLDKEKLLFDILLKDDSQNPTFSFKDRASQIVSAFAKEHNINTIVAASTGNAGSSLAGICASQGQKAIIYVPASAPIAKLTQIMMYGAQIVPVNGTYDDAFEMSLEATRQNGWYNRNTAYNPLTIEGKKTVSCEIFAQNGQKTPNRIFVPTGDGVIISGVYKGFEDLLMLGLIDKIPEIIAVQAEGSANIVNNLRTKSFTAEKSSTLADSISVDIPRNFFMARKFLNDYKGKGLTVTDDEILSASILLSKNTGIFTEPAAAASFAGFLKYYQENKIENNSQNVILLTGSGLKDLKSVQKLIKIPKAIEK